ncbi:MAG: SRPBCC family protein [Rhodothermales bacterium]|nr:SRPBCC family protein [Rhodothermales bacterium]
MKAVKIILVAILVIFFLLVIVGFLLPAEWEVSESVAIEATPAEVYPHVAEFRQWPAWTAWAAADPDMTYSYSGTETGVGQVTEWSGNQGTGRMEITGVDSLRRIDYYFSMDDNAFGAASSIVLDNVGGETHVTWSSEGDVGGNIAARYFMKVFTPYMSADYQSGLDRLKELAESGRGG